MFSVQASALEKSIQKLLTASAQFIQAFKQNQMEQMVTSSQDGTSCLIDIVNRILSYRDEAVLSKNIRFTEPAVGLIYQEGINDQIKKSVMLKKDEGLKNLNSSIPSANILLNKVKHVEPKKSTFDVIDSEHILFISGKEFLNSPEYILRFSINDFCSFCQNFVGDIDQYYK